MKSSKRGQFLAEKLKGVSKTLIFQKKKKQNEIHLGFHILKNDFFNSILENNEQVTLCWAYKIVSDHRHNSMIVVLIVHQYCIRIRILY